MYFPGEVIVGVEEEREVKLMKEEGMVLIVGIGIGTVLDSLWLEEINSLEIQFN